MRSALAALMGLCWALLAAAHPMPETRAWLDTTDQGLHLTLQLPLNRLEFAYGQALAVAPAQALQRHAEGLAQYLLQHVGARSQGQGWQVLRPQLTLEGADDSAGGSAELHAVMELRAPPGVDPRQFTLLLDVVVHEVRTHRIQVFLRQDWQGGRAGAAPQLLGELDSQHRSLAVQLQPPGQGASLRSLFQHGAQHIAKGTDHLLFLLTLLLVAPLQAHRRQWVGTRPTGPALRRLLGMVSAFTLGHSLTLALGSTGVLTWPGPWLEVAVAGSIVLAALHAWKPLMARGELWMAGGFGLLHGLAFAGSLQGAGLSPGQHAQALLAFNLGIEAVQLGVVAAAMPPLLALAQWTPGFYGTLRRATAALAAMAATVWVWERLQPLDAPFGAPLDGPFGALFGPWIDEAAAFAPAVAAGLWLIAGFVWWRQPQAPVRLERLRRRPSDPLG